jgi:hypothetical protein
MAFGIGENSVQGNNITVVRRPRRRVWFLNGDLVRVEHTSRAAGIVTLYNLTKDRRETAVVVEFKKKRKRAFTVKETAQLLNCHRKHIPRLVKRGVIPDPVGELPDGKRAFHYLSYYSEEVIMEARKAMSQIHHGAARKDGLITNNKTPTEQELRYAMGDGILLYTKTEDGRFIPIFNETI